jgi:hypothetical protein
VVIGGGEKGKKVGQGSKEKRKEKKGKREVKPLNGRFSESRRGNKGPRESRATPGWKESCIDESLIH